MYATGHILCRQTYNALGQLESEDYEWQGGNVAIVTSYSGGITAERFDPSGKPGRVESIGPYRVRLIEPRYEYRGWLVIRETPFAWLYAWLYRMQRPVSLAYYRLIITASVWGLAKCQQGAIPHWTDIHVLRRLFKRNRP